MNAYISVSNHRPLPHTNQDNNLSIEELRAKYAGVAHIGDTEEEDDLLSSQADDSDNDVAERPSLPPVIPDQRPPPAIPSMTPLVADTAMRLAASWYNTAGPYRHLYQMAPMEAACAAPTEWSVRFRVAPDTGFVYFRHFTYAANDETGVWEVVAWREDPARPDVEFRPPPSHSHPRRSSHGSGGKDHAAAAGEKSESENASAKAGEKAHEEDDSDDSATIDEEERISRSTRESATNEVQELEDVR